MSLNPHIRTVLRSAQQYRDGAISIEGLQANLSGEVAAMEGDVPRQVRDAVTRAEAWIDSARFSRGGSLQREEAERALEELERVISRYYAREIPEEGD
jgi:hypothetical protein